MKVKNVFISLFVVLILVTGLLLAGCDSGSDSSGSGTGT